MEARLLFFSVFFLLLLVLFLSAAPPSSSSSPPPSSAAGKAPRRKPFCFSWRFNVEVNNLRDWSTVPDSCETFVAAYMNGAAYLDDSTFAAAQALDYAESYNVSLRAPAQNDNGRSEGKKSPSSSSSSSSSTLVWIFDIDETSLSNLPYYVHHRFGVEAYNDTLFEEWVDEAIAPALPASLKLFNDLKDLGYSIFFLTGRSEKRRNVTVTNLENAGYSGWEGLILRQTNESSLAAEDYKSAKRKALEDLGYVIVGNIGDQWSDISGYSVGSRTFKLPNPMYYIS